MTDLPEDIAFGRMSEAIHDYLELMGLSRDETEHDDVYETAIDVIVEGTPDGPYGEES